MYQLQDEIDRLSGNCRGEADQLPNHQWWVNLEARRARRRAIVLRRASCTLFVLSA